MNKYKKSLIDDLGDIYKDQKGTMRYNNKLERRGIGMPKLFFLIILFLGIIGLTVWLGYYVFREPQMSNFNKDELTFEIKGTESVNSGEDAFYVVDYQNKGDIDLINNEIQLTYPEGFRVKMVEPMPDDLKHNIWHIERIKSGENGQIKIQGSLIGGIGNENEIKANLRYNPINTNAFFSKEYNFKVKIKDIYLDIKLNVTPKFNLEKKERMVIKCINNSLNEMERIRLIFQYPKGSLVFVNDEENKSNKNEYILDIEKLNGKEEKEIILDIVLNNKDAAKEKLKAQIGYIDADNKFILQREVEKDINILEDNLTSELIINGISNDGCINSGKKLNYSLRLKNMGNLSLLNVEPKVIIDDNNNLLDWQTLEFPEKEGLKADKSKLVENKEIIWKPDECSLLQEVKPSDEIELNFFITLKSGKEIDASKILENNISSWAEIKIGKIGDLNEDKVIKSNLVKLRLNALLDFRAEVRYFNEAGEPIGSGPLPPKLGEETNYKIFWKLNNSLSEVKDIKIIAKLSENVQWKEKVKVDSGELYLNQDTKEIIWSVPRLPGDLKKPMEAVFGVSIKPQSEDLGKNIILLDNIAISGADSYTGAKINSSNGFITTDLEQDEVGYGKGKVVE